MSANTVRIDFISDIACPWCVVGLGGLLTAMQKLRDEVSFEMRFQPFELNPDMPPEGENLRDHVARKYGSAPERSDAVREAIRDHGAAYGFTFNYGPESRIWNTFDAHRLLHWAASAGKQLPLKQALFKMNFTDEKPANNRAALLEAARDAGLDVTRAAEVLDSGEYADAIRQLEAHWHANGIQAVPSVIFNERWLVQGAQPPEAYEQVIRDVISGNAKEA